MAGPALRWKATAGFLMMTFLIPGTYALKCYTSTSFQQYDSKGRYGFEKPSMVHSETCSSGHDVCISVQIEVGTDGNTLLVIHRGCFTKSPRDAEGDNFGPQFFAIRSNLSYCHGDLCNTGPDSEEIPKLTSKDTVSPPSGSIQCYSGQNHNTSELNLEQVTCSNSSSLCYQGRLTITVGNITEAFYIRSCQSSSCDVPNPQSIGPIELSFLEDSCCAGTYCNKKEDLADIPNNSTSGPTGTPYGAGDHTTDFTDPDTGNGIQGDADYDNYSFDAEDGDSSDGSANPRGHGPNSEGSSLQFCPLLLAIGMTALELRW